MPLISKFLKGYKSSQSASIPHNTSEQASPTNRSLFPRSEAAMSDSAVPINLDLLSQEQLDDLLSLIKTKKNKESRTAKAKKAEATKMYVKESLKYIHNACALTHVLKSLVRPVPGPDVDPDVIAEHNPAIKEAFGLHKAMQDYISSNPIRLLKLYDEAHQARLETRRQKDAARRATSQTPDSSPAPSPNCCDNLF